MTNSSTIDRSLHCLGVLGVVSGLSLLGMDSAFAQNIVLDGTLGTAQTLTGPNYIIRQQDGLSVGENLFHSFERFNLGSGEVAAFQSTNQIRNILSRVTGGFPSLINGQIYTESFNVNFYLINPNGIIFGPNARLDIGSPSRGSFVATTLDALTFSNGGTFSAMNPGGATNLLTLVGDPSGFLASQRTIPAIASSSRGLAVYPGQSLLFLGGEVNLDRSTLFVQSFSGGEGGRVELGGVSGPGTVGLTVNGNLLSLSIPDGMPRADIAIRNESFVSVIADNGGSIALNARNIALSQSVLQAGIGRFLGELGSQAGDITINATETTTATSSALLNIVGFLGTGNAGNIRFNTGSLVFTDGAQITTSAQDRTRGNSGSVIINARDRVVFDGAGTVVDSSLVFLGEGQAGDIQIDTGSLSVTNGAQFQTNTVGKGNGGDVIINARDQVSFQGRQQGFPSAIFTTVLPDAQGNAGSIQIRAGSVAMQGARFDLINFADSGDAGNVVIQVRDTLSLSDQALIAADGDRGGSIQLQGQQITLTDQSAIQSVTVSKPGGAISVRTNQLSIQNGSGIASATVGSGQGGNLQVFASESVDIIGTRSDSRAASGLFTNSFGSGAAGDLTIATSRLSLLAGGTVSASTLNNGRGGTVRIDASESVTVAGESNNIVSGILSTTQRSGKAGDMLLTTRNLAIREGGQVSTSTFGSGQGGTIEVFASDSIDLFGISSGGETNRLPNPSGIFVSTHSSGSAGDLRINTSNLRIGGGARASASVIIGSGQGGNLAVNANAINLYGVSPDGRFTSGLFADTRAGATGQGGDLRIATGQLTVRDGARVTVSSQGTGEAGNLDITARTIQLNNQGKLIAETTSGNGGNIKLQVSDLLLLRRNSLISATAGTAQAGGNGGNITITAPFVIGVLSENSDITANAFTGRGGNITITTQGIFGLKVQSQLTPNSDITASSQFGVSGTVTLNILNVDPNRGLVALPVNLVDPSQQIAQSCSPRGAGQASSFVATGRGGLPISPDQPLRSQNTISQWVSLENNNQENLGSGEQTSTARELAIAPDSPPQSLPSPSSPIVEAQSWMVDGRGNYYLVAQTVEGERASLASFSSACPLSSSNK